MIAKFSTELLLHCRNCREQIGQPEAIKKKKPIIAQHLLFNHKESREQSMPVYQVGIISGNHMRPKCLDTSLWICSML